MPSVFMRRPVRVTGAGESPERRTIYPRKRMKLHCKARHALGGNFTRGNTKGYYSALSRVLEGIKHYGEPRTKQNAGVATSQHGKEFLWHFQTLRDW